MIDVVDGQSTKPRILLDCDPGIDDAVALAVAAAHTEIVGISTVGGNVELESTTANALALCALLDLEDTQIHAGHDMPLNGSLKHRAAQFHGPRGTGDIELSSPDRQPTSTDAVQWIIDTVRTEEGLWLVPTGPLTNVADAFRKAPDIVDRIEGISWMGGSSTIGNMTATAEFNCWVDPEAADIVFRSGHPKIIMSGLNITTQVVFPRSKIDELGQAAGDETASIFADLLNYYATQQQSTTGRTGAVIHDIFAVLAVTHPHLLTGVDRHVEVVLHEGPTRAMTVVDQRLRQNPGPTNVTVIEQADVAAITALLFETLHP